MTVPQRLRLASGLFAAVCVLLVCHGVSSGHLFLFKDGFTIQGKLGRHEMFHVDRKAKVAFTVPVPGTPYYIETKVRTVLFSPDQLHDVLEDKATPIPNEMIFEYFARVSNNRMPVMWHYEQIGDWQPDLERMVVLKAPAPPAFPGQQPGIRLVKDRQRLHKLDPEWLLVYSLDHFWMLTYRTSELGPETTEKLLRYLLKKARDRDKKLTELDVELRVGRFLMRVGWTERARQIFEKALAQHPDQASAVQPDLDAAKRVLALEFLGDLELAKKVGRHREAQKRIARFFDEGMNKLLGDDKYEAQVFDLKSRYDQQNKQIAEAKRLLGELPKTLSASSQPFFTQAANVIQAELTHDTIDRLETFLTQARLYELAVKEKRKPSLSGEQLVAFAVSGWVLGNNAAKENIEEAGNLWRARTFLEHYLRNDDRGPRKTLRDEFAKNGKVAVDLLARLVRYLPPPRPHDRLDRAVQQLQVVLPDSANAPIYHLKLPAEYNHLRPHPVLIVLANCGEPPVKALERWADQAGKHGYILIAPEWAAPQQRTYQYSDHEHQIVLACLRDVRKRFQVDSNRVFLAGCEEGGMAAFDIGLAHPDEFAGVLPMSSWPEYFPPLYWSNGMYLPFYVVDGDKHGESPAKNEKIFKNWVRHNFPSLLIKYKGRGREWFAGELPEMFDWMGRKQRYFPLKQLGSAGSATSDEVFRTLRPGDNRFYWLGTSQINPLYVFRPGQQLTATRKTANLTAAIYAGNEIRVYTDGIDRLTIWIAPGMIDFGQKVKVVHNYRRHHDLGRLQPNLGVMLEELHASGDRQRLYLARIDLDLTK